MAECVNGYTIEKINEIVSHFVVHGTVVSFEKINKGYINRTFTVKTVTGDGKEFRYILQRINDNVFKDIGGLMANIVLVVDHLADTFTLPGQRNGWPSVLSLRFAKDGKSFYKDETGYWRVMRYFDNVRSFDIPDDPEVFRHAGASFGQFIRCLSDIDPKMLHVTIPDFHNTPARYNQLLEAVEKDPVGRKSNVLCEIELVKKYAPYYGFINDALEKGVIPYRVCHNDCNLNNILFDYDSKLPVAIIDLDTVMPSSPLYDFGDSMRIGTNTARDDEKDLSKVECDLSLFREYAIGFLTSCGKMLTKDELRLLPYSAMIITAEDAIRFLTDYINGDVYYSAISYPTQNLDRARNQMMLAVDMAKKTDKIKKILTEIYSDLGLYPAIE